MKVAARILGKDHTWRGWEFYTVTTRGGFDPTVVASEWSAADVHDAYWDIMLRAVLE